MDANANSIDGGRMGEKGGRAAWRLVRQVKKNIMSKSAIGK